MALSRRRFLQQLGATGVAAGLAPLLTSCADDTESAPWWTELEEPVQHHFQHGVASGDPLPDAVILWTRFTSEDEISAGGRAFGTPDVGEIEVAWEIATDVRFQKVVQKGFALTDADRDYTVKVDVGELRPNTTYYYRFSARDEESMVGRTKTAPVGDNKNVRFALCSCASGAHGYFTAYGYMAQEDIDAVLHVGDYTYEYGDRQYGSFRSYDPPWETVSLEDYRRRQAWYHKDEDLQSVHQQHPFICIWDDHELADNTWSTGALNHDPATEGDYFVRQAAAQQAYFEWLPIREQPKRGQVWRTLRYGNLVDVVLLDTRMWARTEQGVGPESERDLLGAEQEQWMKEQLQGSQAKWKILAQQIMFAHMTLDKNVVLNSDQWDGYPASRQRMYDIIADVPGGNVVVLTGDIHTAFVCELGRDPYDKTSYDTETGKGLLAVEFVTPSITSPGLKGLSGFPKIIDKLFNASPEIRYIETDHKGYVVMDINKDRIQADYQFVSSITERDASLFVDATFRVKSGSSRVERIGEGRVARNLLPPSVFRG